MFFTLFTSGYLLLRSHSVQTYLTQWIMTQLSDTYQTKISVGGIDISLFKSIVLEKVLVEDLNQDTLIYVDNVELQVDSLRLFEKRIHLGGIVLNGSRINILNDSAGFNFLFLLPKSKADTTSRPETTSPWNITFKNFSILNSQIKYKDLLAQRTFFNGINFNDVEITKLNLSVVNAHFTDSVSTFFLDNASIFEKSGFAIGDLRFGARIDKSGFTLSGLTIVSNHSHIEAKNIKISDYFPRF